MFCQTSDESVDVLDLYFLRTMVKNKVALVTGGVAGIGLSAVKILLENGIRGVSIVDLQEKEGKLVAEQLNEQFGCCDDIEPKVTYIHADVTDNEQLNCAFKATVEKYKNLDIVFNNAGIVNEKNWKKCYDVNLYGSTSCLILAMEDYLPKYKTCPDPIVVNCVSILGMEAWDGLPHLSVTKFGGIGLTLAFGSPNHYKRTGVRVAAVCPGVTNTGMVGGLDNVIVYKKFLDEAMAKHKSQDVCFVGKTFLHVVQCGKSGSIWVISEEQQQEIQYPTMVK